MSEKNKVILRDSNSRGMDAWLIYDKLASKSTFSIQYAITFIGRGTQYIRQLVQNCDELEFASQDGSVRDWIIKRAEGATYEHDGR